jgi:hypothetical protein
MPVIGHNALIGGFTCVISFNLVGIEPDATADLKLSKL